MIDDTEKTYIIAVQREEAYSFDIEAESPEEAVKLMEDQMRKATAHSVPGGTLVRARWVPPSEKPWVVREADKKGLIYYEGIGIDV